MTDLFGSPPTILRNGLIMMRRIVSSVIFSADQNRLAVGAGADNNNQNNIFVWQNNDGECVLLQSLNGGEGDIKAVLFVDERGRFLLSGSTNRAIIHWDVDRQVQLFVFRGHTNTVWSLALLPGTDVFFSASWDKTVGVWNLSHRTQLAAIPVPHFCFSVAVRPTSRHFAASGTGFVVVKDLSACLSSPAAFDASMMTEVGIFPGDSNFIWSTGYTPDGRLLATGSEDRTVKIYNADDNTYPLIRTLAGHTKAIFSVAFDPSGRFVFSGADDRTVKMWDVEEGRCIKTLTHHASGVNSISVSADGSMLVSGSWDGTVAIIPRDDVDAEALFGDIKRDGDE